MKVTKKRSCFANAADAARHYRVCLRTVRYWIARRRLRVHHPAGKGGKVLIWMEA